MVRNSRALLLSIGFVVLILSTKYVTAQPSSGTVELKFEAGLVVGNRIQYLACSDCGTPSICVDNDPPSGLNCSRTYVLLSGGILQDAPISYSAVPASNWKFDGWTGLGCDGGTGDCTPAESIYIASIGQTPHTLTAAFSPLQLIIDGSPSTTVEQGTQYLFKPSAISPKAESTLAFTIQNKPVWAVFDYSTGELRGTPQNADVGITTGIEISVADGTESTSLPAFDLRVVDINEPPVISGAPTARTAYGQAYEFIPVASDPDLNASLSFSIQNKPRWADFNPQTGRLSGTPLVTDIGAYGGILISVSDSDLMAELPVFNITVVDASAPVVTAPPDIDMDATGLFTSVNLGLGTAVDEVDGDVQASTSSASIFRPGIHTVDWRAMDSAGNEGGGEQRVRIRPRAELSKDVSTAASARVTVKLLLNGKAPQYPVEAEFTLGGTAIEGEDYQVPGPRRFIIEDGGLEGSIDLEILPDAAMTSDTTIILTLGDIKGAAAGASNSFTATIRSGNVAPEVTLSASQQGIKTTIFAKDAGSVTVTAVVSDPNPGDTFTFDWSASDQASQAALTSASDQTWIFDPTELLPGVYWVRLTVRDSYGALNTAGIYFRIVETLDAIEMSETNSLPPSALCTTTSSEPTTCADNEISSDNVLQTDPQYTIAPGGTTISILNASGPSFVIEKEPGLNLTLNDLPVEQRDPDGFSYPAGINDFVINGLDPGDSVHVVIPQHAAIPANAVYRKILNAAWIDFYTDEKNKVYSSPSPEGFCPPPKSSEYIPGLTEGHTCVQLLIEDGGPNDADRQVDGAIADPGGVTSRAPSVPTPEPDYDRDGIPDNEDTFKYATTEQTTENFALATALPDSASRCSITFIETQPVELPPAYVGISRQASFVIDGCSLSSPETIDVSIDFKEQLPEGGALYKVSADALTEVPGASFVGTTVRYSLLDNGPLDLDKTPGIIRDPVTIAKRRTQDSPVPVPTHPLWILGVISAFLMLAASRAFRLTPASLRSDIR